MTAVLAATSSNRGVLGAVIVIVLVAALVGAPAIYVLLKGPYKGGES